MAAIVLAAALNWICVLASSNYGATEAYPGRKTVCALLDDGNVKCWGAQAHGAQAQGDNVARGGVPDTMGDFLPPIDLGTGRTATSLTTGAWEYTMCAVLDDGNTKCWGKNDDGQCGIGTNTDVGGAGFDGTSPVAMLGTGRTVQQVAGCFYSMCALLDGGSVKCWGGGLQALGYGDTTTRGTNVNELGDNLPEVDFGTGKVAKALYSGQGSICVILTDDSTKCWGKYQEVPYGDNVMRGTAPGQMGDNLPTIDFGTGRHATHIGLGQNIGCAVLDDGSVKCWSDNTATNKAAGGQDIAGFVMGDSFPAINLGTGKVAVQVATKFQHSCAVFDDGTLKCWGVNDGGQLGLGDTLTRGLAASEMGDNLPTVDVGTGRTVTSVSVSAGFTCALLDDGSTKCWGGGGVYGWLGQGDLTTRGAGANTMGDYLPPIDLGIIPTTSTTFTATTSTSSTGTATTSTSTSTTSSSTSTSSTSSTTTSSSSSTTWTVSSSITTSTSATSSSSSTLTTSSTTATWSSTLSSTSTFTTSTSFTTTSSITTSSSATGSTTTSSTTTRSTTTTSTSTTSTTDSTVTTSSATTRSTTSSSATSSSTTSSSATSSSTTTSSATSSSTTTSSATSSSTTTSSSTSSSTPTSSTTSTSTTTNSTTTASTSTTTISFTTSSSTTTVSSSTSQSSSLTTSISSTSSTTSTTTSSSSTLSSTSATESTVSPTEAPPLDDQAFARLEQQRKEEAAAAVNALDSAEEAAVGQSLQLLSSLLENSNATDGVLAEVSVATDAGVLKVVALSATSVAPESNVSVGGEDGTSVTVPRTVLQQAAAAAGSGLVLLSVTSLSENVTDKIGSDDARLGRRLATAASTLRGQSVSLNFRDAEGNRIEVKNLQTPIELVLAVDNENATCAYYDEASFSWSEEGLETVMDGIPGQITCRTTHLSIFGGVLQFVLSNVIATLKCSTAAQLLSAEALAMLGTSAWLSYGPSVVIFVSLAVFAMVFGCALRMDRRANQAIPWEKKEPVLLRKRTTVAQLIEELPPEEPKTCWERITSFIGAAVDWTLWFIGLLFGYENLAEVVKEFLPNAPVSTVNRCITTIHAHKTGTSRDSIDGVKKLSKTFSRSMSITSAMSGNEDKSSNTQRRRPGLLRELSSSVITTVDSGLKSAHSNGLLPYEEMKKHGAQAVESFLSSTWVKRILLLFPALHPWLETVRFSLFTSHAVRAALIITKLTSAAAVGALFFSSSSTTPDSDPDCQPPTDLLASMVQTATVGIISALLGDLVIFALFILQSRSAVDKNEWNPREKTKILMKWRCKSFVFWSAWSCHAGFSIIYVLLFLANVSLQDAIKWLESCCVSLLQDLILVPLAMAFILATLASFAICCSRKVQHKIENDWLADEESEQDDNEDELEDEDAKGRWIEPGDVQEVEMASENLVSVTLADDQEELHSIELVNSRTGLRDSAHGEAAEEQRRSTSAVLIDPEDDCTSIYSEHY